MFRMILPARPPIYLFLSGILSCGNTWPCLFVFMLWSYLWTLS